MRSTSRITAAVLAFFVACTTLPPDSEQPTVESVYAMVDSFHVAFAAEDSARLGRLISEDSTMTFYGTSLSEMQRGRSEFLVKHQEQDWAQVDDITFSEPSDVDVQLTTAMAVITYHTRLGFVAGGEAGSLPLRMTLTLGREAGVWKIRQGSASPVGDG